MFKDIKKIGCNPCCNGNDLQEALTLKQKRKCCNPCYNGNDLQAK